MVAVFITHLVFRTGEDFEDCNTLTIDAPEALRFRTGEDLEDCNTVIVVV